MCHVIRQPENSYLVYAKFMFSFFQLLKKTSDLWERKKKLP